MIIKKFKKISFLGFSSKLLIFFYFLVQILIWDDFDMIIMVYDDILIWWLRRFPSRNPNWYLICHYIWHTEKCVKYGYLHELSIFFTGSSFYFWSTFTTHFIHPIWYVAFIMKEIVNFRPNPHFDGGSAKSLLFGWWTVVATRLLGCKSSTFSCDELKFRCPNPVNALRSLTTIFSRVVNGQDRSLKLRTLVTKTVIR